MVRGNDAENEEKTVRIIGDNDIGQNSMCVTTATANQPSDRDNGHGRLIVNEINDFSGVVAVNHKGALLTDRADLGVRAVGGHKLMKTGCG